MQMNKTFPINVPIGKNTLESKKSFPKNFIYQKIVVHLQQILKIKVLWLKKEKKF